MIDKIDFKRCLARARSAMNLHLARQSLKYGHALDSGLNVGYESKYDLIQWLDRWTKERSEKILSEDLSKLSPDERNLVDLLDSAYGRFAKTITTTPPKPFSQGAFYETVLDYRYLSKHLQSSFNVIDFGPGCGRHGTAFHITGNHGIYVGVDCVELLYILQNAIWSFLLPESFHDLLDYEIENKAFPDMEKAYKGSIFHMPAWHSERLPLGFFDVIIACHVLDEIPRGDFDRLMAIAGQCLKPGGIIYARGTIHAEAFLGMAHYHGYDIYRRIEENGFTMALDDYFPSQAYHVCVWRKG